MAIEIENLYRGILSGVIVGLLHTIIADGLIAMFMTGHFFYVYGGNLLGAIINETIKNIILGGALGAVGAYIALNTKK